SAIITTAGGVTLMSTEQGNVFECRVRAGAAIETRSLLNEPLRNADRERPGPLTITSISRADNRVFIGTLSRGVLEIENGAVRESTSRPAAFFVNALERGHDGKLWAGARARKEEPGAFTGTEPSNLKRTEAATGPVLTLKSIGEELWIGTDGRGVFRVSKAKTQRFTFDGTAGGLRSDHVYAIFADREGVIWFGTDRGVCRYDPHAPRVESVGDNSDSNFVRALYQTSNGKTIAGTNRGLFVYDDKTAAWNLVPGLGQNIIYAVAEDRAQRLLVASVSGFYVSSKPSAPLEEQQFGRLEPGSITPDGVGSVRSIAQFNGATYYAIFGRGVDRIDGGRASLTWANGTSPSREVLSLLADNDRLLIGTAKDGVFVSDGKTIQDEPAFAILKGPAVRSMARTADGSLWFGTSAGVYLCRTEGGCTLALQNVDARFVIAGQSSEANEIWCGTRGNGVVRILLDPVVGPVVSELDSEQGLPTQNAFAVLPQREADGTDVLLIGTNRGIARYEPGSFAPSLSVTRILSKRVHAPSELQAGLNLEYPQNSLLLDVTAISSRTFPEQFQYAFTLTDSSGQPVKQRLARDSQFTMEGLKPGKYTVTARAFTKDLTPSDPLTFSFTVANAPFPWTSTALAILLALALLALLWAILERRRIVATSAALVDANRELADARLNLANEAERERRRIARDLHDQTLADLRHLALLTDQIKTNGEPPAQHGKQTAALRNEIESISQEVRRICEDLSPSVLQNVGFAAALEFALSHAVQDAPAERRFEYEFHCDEAVEERSELPPSVQMQIYRIVQEAVNNIWRHAGATEVNMFVNSSPEGDFSLRIEDNGCSFESQPKNSEGRGLANMRARAGLIDANIAWQPREGGGTVFTLGRRAARSEVSAR
ncbi:MAG TPA: two-component regulator propeller domain-containing protein, partial [Pyrinomonadaceae bacterium]|nr:two-component regulator propeller domain-containing protein [Pyrinomonadaceae bacterium]